MCGEGGELFTCPYPLYGLRAGGSTFGCRYMCVCGEGAELFTCPYPLYGLRAGGSTFGCRYMCVGRGVNYLHVHIHSTVSGQEEAHLVVGICVCVGRGLNYLHVHIHSTVSGQEEAHLVVGICVCGEGAELFTCPYPLYGLRAGGSTFGCRYMCVWGGG